VQMDEIITRMTGRGMTLTDTEVMSVFNEFGHMLDEILHEGCAVATPFMKIVPSIAGVFRNSDDTFDPERHEVRYNASLGKGVKIDPRRIKLQKEKIKVLQPEMTSVKDYHTLLQDQVMKRGGTVEIKGLQLKVFNQDPEQGLYIGRPGNEVRVTTYIINKPSMLIFQVPPNIAAGEVYITLKNKLPKSSTLRTGTYGVPLTIID